MVSSPRRSTQGFALVAATLAVACTPSAATAAAAPQWTAPLNLSTPGSSTAYALGGATLADGTTLVQWQHIGLGPSTIGTASVSRGATTSSLFDLTDLGMSPQENTAPQIVSLPNGNAIALSTVYVSDPDDNFVVASDYNAASKTWSTPATITADVDAYGQELVSATVTPNGDVTVLYYSFVDMATVRMRSTTRAAGASSWSAPVTVQTMANSLDYRGGSATATPDGRIVAVWNSQQDGDNAVLSTATRSADGTWSEPVALAGDNTAAAGTFRLLGAAVDSDGKGNVTAAWVNMVNQRAYVAELPSGSSSWSAPTQLDTDLAEYPSAFNTISLSVNDAGDAAIGWRLNPVSVQQRALSPAQLGLATRPHGGTWKSQLITDLPLDFSGEAPMVSVDAGGTATLATYAENDQIVARRAPVSTGALSASQVIEAGSPYAPYRDDYDQLTGMTAADGSFTIAWAAQNDDDNTQMVRVATLDTAGPVQSAVNIPSTAKVGVAASFSLTAKDVLSETGATTWSFGDGGTATGTAASHTYAKVGTYTVKSTSVDQYGNESVTTREITVTGGAPVCSGTRKGTKITVKCELSSTPTGRIKINGKVQRIKKDGSWGKIRDRARTYTRSSTFTLYFDVRSARKGNYALTLTPAGQPRAIVVLSV